MNRQTAFLLALLLSAGSLAHLQHLRLGSDYAAGRETDVLETLPTSAILKPLTLGYHALAADYYYLKAIQHFGNLDYHWVQRPYPQLAALLNLAVELDPWYRAPYRMGGLTLTLRNMNAAEANNLLFKAIKRYPRDYQLVSLLGFNLFHFEGRYQEAAAVLAQAAKLPEAPDWMPGLATRVAAEGGKPELGIAMVNQVIPTINDERLRKQLIERRMWLELELDLNTIDRAAARFREQHSSEPSSLEQLVAEGLLELLPSDPFGGKYQLGPTGQAMSTTGKERLRTFKPGKRPTRRKHE